MFKKGDKVRFRKFNTKKDYCMLAVVIRPERYEYLVSHQLKEYIVKDVKYNSSNCFDDEHEMISFENDENVNNHGNYGIYEFVYWLELVK